MVLQAQGSDVSKAVTTSALFETASAVTNDDAVYEIKVTPAA